MALLQLIHLVPHLLLSLLVLGHHGLEVRQGIATLVLFVILIHTGATVGAVAISIQVPAEGCVRVCEGVSLLTIGWFEELGTLCL